MDSPDNPNPPDPELLAPLPPPPAEPPRIPDPYPWGFGELITIAIVTLASVALLGWAALALAGYELHMKLTNPALQENAKLAVAAQFVAYLVVLAFMSFLVRSHGKTFWSGIHWNWPGRSGLAYWLGGIAVAVVIELISSRLPIPKRLPMDQYFNDTLSAYVVAIFGITLGPLLEELYFRGFMFPVFARHLRVALAVFFTAIPFAALHGSQLAFTWAPLLMIFCVGLVLTYVRARTDSVARSFLMHVGYNTTLFGGMFIATGAFRHMERLQ